MLGRVRKDYPYLFAMIEGINVFNVKPRLLLYSGVSY